MATETFVRDKYLGEKFEQIRQGFGVYYYENKFFRYEGEWHHGKKHGHGKLVMADGSYYEGQFEHGEIQGHGTKYYASSGNEYSGCFSEGELDGQGVMKYGNGDQFEGEWCRNKRQGYGVFTGKDASSYRGYLYRDMKHGEGVNIYSNGDVYTGDWVNNKRQGHGELRTIDGSIYDGQWSNDQPSGQGSMIHSSGVVYEGLWINGRPSSLASKLVMKNSGRLVLDQGAVVDLEVECQDDDNQLVADEGREIEILGGIPYTQLPEEIREAHENGNLEEEKELLELLESIEQQQEPEIVVTPFGFSMVPYSLTDKIIVDTNQNSTLSREVTSISTQSIVEQDQEKEDETQREETEEQNEEQEEEEQNENVQSDMVEETSQGVLNKRTEAGEVVFRNVTFPAAPADYRPYLIEEAIEKFRQYKIKKEEEVTQQELGVEDPPSSETPKKEVKKSKKGEKGLDTAAKPAQETVAPESHSQSPLPDSRVDMRMCKEGEYVILVRDVSKPPFLGLVLEPVFLQVTVKHPTKQKKRSTRSKGPSEDSNESQPNISEDNSNRTKKAAEGLTPETLIKERENKIKIIKGNKKSTKKAN